MKLYKAVSMAVLGVMLAGGAAHAQERNQEELEARLRALREEMRDLERQLGRDLASEFRVRRLEEGIPRVLTWMSNRARLGVVVRTEANDETDAVGAVLSSVTPGSPADEAGLEAGDIIVSVDGQPLANTDSRRETDESAPAMRLIDRIRDHDAGDEVTIEYRRNGQTLSTIATLREMDDEPGYAFRFGTGGDFEMNPRIIRDMSRFELGGPNGLITIFGGPWSDIELVSLNESLGRYFGTDEGLLVVQAPDEESMQLQSGDVILSIDGREARTPSRAMRIFRSYEEGESFDLEIMRDQQRMTVTATIPEQENHFRRREYRRF